VKRGLRNGVAPYIPAAFCRDAGSAGHGATGTVAASPGFRVRDGNPPGGRPEKTLPGEQQNRQ
ncbi:hypothetical protein TE35_004861, partial [Escherichia coli]|nr:hypothetical protein [Escherichia coli]